MAKDKRVDDYIKKNEKYQEALLKLRKLAIESGANETVKWGMPTYTVGGKNVFGLAAFKEHVGIWFFQGAVHSDPLGLLSNAQEGKTHAMRHWKFATAKDIKIAKVKAYLKEAIENQKAGKKAIIPKVKKVTVLPELLTEALSKDSKLRANFDNLTPGRQRDYCEYINTAKREATKLSRLDKILPMIRRGVGMDDLYRKK